MAPVLAWTWLHVSILECAIALRTGRHAKAVEVLESTLEMTQRLDVLRPLSTAPNDVVGLLADRAGTLGPYEQLALRLLALHPGDAKHTKSFTRCEQDILMLLPSHFSPGQIALELQLSVNTVKTHSQAIYVKLGAASRHDAVTTAYQLGYLREPTDADSTTVNPERMSRGDGGWF